MGPFLGSLLHQGMGRPLREDCRVDVADEKLPVVWAAVVIVISGWVASPR